MSEELNLNVAMNGFRKGVTKKSLIKSLSDDDWKRLDAQKSFEEVQTKNVFAAKLFLFADQSRAEMERVKRGIDKGLLEILRFSAAIKRSEMDLLIGRTDQKGKDGELISVDDLKLHIFDMKNKAESFLAILRVDCCMLFRYVGTKGFDMKPMFTEDEYNAKIEAVIEKLSKTQFKLF